MWTQEQLECFERAVKDLEGLVETLEELVGNLEERLARVKGNLPEAWERGGGHDGE